MKQPHHTGHTQGPSREELRELFNPNLPGIPAGWATPDSNLPSPKPQPTAQSPKARPDPAGAVLGLLRRQGKAQQLATLQQWGQDLLAGKTTTGAEKLKVLIGTTSGLSQLVQLGLGGQVADALSRRGLSALLQRYDSVRLLQELAENRQAGATVRVQANALAENFGNVLTQRAFASSPLNQTAPTTTVLYREPPLARPVTSAVAKTKSRAAAPVTATAVATAINTAPPATMPALNLLKSLGTARKVQTLIAWGDDVLQGRASEGAYALRQLIGTTEGLRQLVHAGMGGSIAAALSQRGLSTLLLRYNTVSLLSGIANEARSTQPAVARAAADLAARFENVLTQRVAATQTETRAQPRIEIERPVGRPVPTAPAKLLPRTQPSPITRTPSAPGSGPQQVLQQMQRQLEGLKGELERLAAQGQLTASQAQRVVGELQTTMNEVLRNAQSAINSLPGHMQSTAQQMLNQASSSFNQWLPGALNNLEQFAQGAIKVVVVAIWVIVFILSFGQLGGEART